MATSKFVKNPNFSNEVLLGDDFHISYNPATGAGIPLAAILSGLVGAPNGLPETALCVHPDEDDKRVWYILNGDFRKEYEEAFPNGLETCLEVYRRNIQHRSDWSTDSY